MRLHICPPQSNPAQPRLDLDVSYVEVGTTSGLLIAASVALLPAQALPTPRLAPSRVLSPAVTNRPEFLEMVHGCGARPRASRTARAPASSEQADASMKPSQTAAHDDEGARGLRVGSRSLAPGDAEAFSSPQIRPLVRPEH